MRVRVKAIPHESYSHYRRAGIAWGREEREVEISNEKAEKFRAAILKREATGKEPAPGEATPAVSEDGVKQLQADSRLMVTIVTDAMIAEALKPSAAELAAQKPSAEPAAPTAEEKIEKSAEEVKAATRIETRKSYR